MKSFGTLIHKLLPSGGKGSLRNDTLINPSREWGICLALTFAAALALFGYSARVFHLQLNDQYSVEAPTTDTVQYREAEAKNIIEYYETRKSAFDTLRQNKIIAAPVVTELSPAIPEAVENLVAE